MEMLVACVLTGICTILASSGFWAFMMRRLEKKSSQAEMLRGLGHDRIMELGTRYVLRGWLTPDEYENFHDYLFKPYERLGGNGTARHMMNRVDALQIRMGPPCTDCERDIK